MTDAALLAALADALSPAQVTDCRGGDVDPRTASNPTGRSVGVPVAWVRPAHAEQLSAVVRVAAQAGRPVVAVGEASTYWDALRVDGAVAIDTRALRSPTPDEGVDVTRRTARVGAGVTVRALDQAARARGLALAAHPDNGGDSSVGSLVAVGCAAGLGMGRALPIELVSGATAVTGDGRVLRLGASHALAGLGYTRHGLPDLLGLLSAAEGRGALIADATLLLEPAPFTVTGSARGPRGRGVSSALLEGFLGASRAALDGGSVDSLRFEAMASRASAEVDHAVMFRTFAPDDPRAALDRARAIAAALSAVGFEGAQLESETDAGRRGLGADYDRHWFAPAGRHRATLARGAFWGADVTVGWGDELATSIEVLRGLFARAAQLDPHERRLGVYPGRHCLSAGLQVSGRQGPEPVAALRALLAAELPALLAAGAVPYRVGHLWRESLADRLAASGGGATAEAVRDALHGLDPRGLLGL